MPQSRKKLGFSFINTKGFLPFLKLAYGGRKPAGRKASEKGKQNMLLKDLKKGEYFRMVSPSGLLSRETYIKGDYDRSEKKYLCARCSDVLGSGRYMRSNQEISTEFIY